MNNSTIAFDDLEKPTLDIKSLLRQRQQELVNIIESIEAVLGTKEYRALQLLVLNGVVESIEKRLNTEIKKNILDTPEIYRLNGQLTWANKYADLNKLMDSYKLELNSLRNKLHA